MEKESFVWALDNLEVYEQPRYLSRPPFLYYWAIEGGKWRLRNIYNEKRVLNCCFGGISSSSSSPSSPSSLEGRIDESACLRYDGIIEHVVLEGDTIESILEYYQITIHSLLQCNGSNIITSSSSTSSTSLPKYLRIPVKKGFPVSKIQLNEKNVIFQRFLNETDLTSNEAEELLNACQYDFIKAMNLWDNTHTWEEKYFESLKQTAPIYTTSYSALRNEDVVQESVTSSLPPPPIGYEWKLLSNNQWELQPYSELSLLQSNNQNEQEEQIQSRNGLYFIHQIRPSDTLEGICLKYHKSQREVMKLNHLSTKKIQFLSELRIPLNVGEKPIIQQSEDDIIVEETVKQNDLCQKFSQDTGLSIKESKYYLQLYNYDFESAFNEWKAEEEWAQQSKLPLSQNTIPLEISY